MIFLENTVCAARRGDIAHAKAQRLLPSNGLVMSTKIGKRIYGGQHLPAELGKPILNARWVLAIVAAKNQTVVLQLTQAIGEYLLRDTRKVAAQLVKAPGPHTQIADDEQLPLSADERHRRRDWALRELLFGLHGKPPFLTCTAFSNEYAFAEKCVLVFAYVLILNITQAGCTREENQFNERNRHVLIRGNSMRVPPPRQHPDVAAFAHFYASGLVGLAEWWAGRLPSLKLVASIRNRLRSNRSSRAGGNQACSA